VECIDEDDRRRQFAVLRAGLNLYIFSKQKLSIQMDTFMVLRTGYFKFSIFSQKLDFQISWSLEPDALNLSVVPQAKNCQFDVILKRNPHLRLFALPSQIWDFLIIIYFIRDIVLFLRRDDPPNSINNGSFDILKQTSSTVIVFQHYHKHRNFLI
jgi:hypothetical protein